MRRDELSRRWMSLGSHDVWGRAGHMTYEAVPYDALPALSRPVSEPFAWLRVAPKRREGLRIDPQGGEAFARRVLG